MSALGESIETLFEQIQPRRDSDLADRLNYCFTTGMLIICAAIIFGWEFCGTPISCWFPAQFTDSWVTYAEDYCYVQNTWVWPLVKKGGSTHHNVSFTASHLNQIPQDLTVRMQRSIPYYQWVPFFLSAQAFLFFLHIVLWRNLNSVNGICTDTILTTCNEVLSMDKEEKRANLKKIANFLYYGMLVEETTGQHRRERMYKTSHICIIYLGIKAFSFFNAIVQFALLAEFLEYRYDFGYVNLVQLSQGIDWEESLHFPRITMCDFEVRVLGNLHRHTVQCFLLINMFSEKIFIFLWWWYLFLIIVNGLSVVSWAWEMWGGKDDSVLKSYQCEASPNGMPDPSGLEEFYNHILHTDGFFILKLIRANTGDEVSFDLFKELWQRFLDDRQKRFDAVLNRKPHRRDLVSKRPNGVAAVSRRPNGVTMEDRKPSSVLVTDV